MHRLLGGLAALLLLLLLLPSGPAGATPRRAVPTPDDTAVVVYGVGAAHGLGLAMDGVLGQSNAGWRYRQILSLFYPGTKPGKASGTIRVGLASGAEHELTLPTGGEVSDAPPGTPPGPGFPIRAPAGAAVVIGYADGAYTVRVGGLVHAAQAEPVQPLPTAPPIPSGGPVPTPEQSASPEPTAPAAVVGSIPRAAPVRRPIWVVPAGSPALTVVAGHRYRGAMEVRFTQALWVVNHVDLETYVRGIAEEKGAGWPHEGLKVLAVAARSLGSATMTWYTRNRQSGYDICATDRCQVYLGYDGEEPSLTRAAAATSAEVLQHAGRPILAMYHGNGGGRTESYNVLYGDGISDPYPYLRSVEYPFASPKRWQTTFASGQAADALRGAGVRITGPLRGVEVLERGLSPRVLRMRINGTTDTTGLQFQAALGLQSSWFDVAVGGAAPPVPDAIVARVVDPGLRAGGSHTTASEPGRHEPWRPDRAAVASLVLAAAFIAVARARR